MGCSWEERCGTSFGRRLTSAQRTGLVFTVLCLLGANIFYVIYAVKQFNHATANPAVSLGSEQWSTGTFPGFIVSTVPVHVDPSSTADDCPILSGTCALSRVPAGSAPQPWPNPPVPIACGYHATTAYVPSSNWISRTPYVDSTGSYIGTELDVTIVTAVNASANAPPAACQRLQVIVFGSTDPNAYLTRQASNPLGIPIGHYVQVFIAASGDRAADGTVTYRAEQTGFIDLGIIPASMGLPPGATRIHFSSDLTQTSPDVTVRTSTVTYTALDALAGVFAVLNASVTAIAILFPATPLVRHARLWLLSAARYTDDPPNDENVGLADAAATGHSTAAAGGGNRKAAAAPNADSAV